MNPASLWSDSFPDDQQQISGFISCFKSASGGPDRVAGFVGTELVSTDVRSGFLLLISRNSETRDNVWSFRGIFIVIILCCLAHESKYDIRHSHSFNVNPFVFCLFVSNHAFSDVSISSPQFLYSLTEMSHLIFQFIQLNKDFIAFIVPLTCMYCVVYLILLSGSIGA